LAGLVVSAYITDHSWFVLYKGRAGARPLGFQWRQKPQLTQLTDPNSTETVFKRKKFLYGADSRYNTFGAFFPFAIGSSVA